MSSDNKAKKRKEYMGKLPKCDRCRRHHTGRCKNGKCDNCGRWDTTGKRVGVRRSVERKEREKIRDVTTAGI